MVRFAIVEDDPEQAKRIVSYCAKYSADHGEEVATDVYASAVVFLEGYRGDYSAVFLDIAMPVMNGMECAEAIRKRDEQVAIVFITSMAQYAIRGYEVEAMAFLLKPVKYAVFASKVDRILSRLHSRPASSYAIQLKDGVRVMDVNDIFYVEVVNHYLVFHTKTGVCRTFGNLGALEEQDCFRRFIRPGQSYLVNASHVAHIGKDILVPFLDKNGGKAGMLGIASRSFG